jgi:hypothetical protein
MPMRLRCKVRTIEKVENFSRTATAQKIVATHEDKSVHACAIGAAMDAEIFFNQQCALHDNRVTSSVASRLAGASARMANRIRLWPRQAVSHPPERSLAGYEPFRRRIFPNVAPAAPGRPDVPQSLGAMR